jgi:ornithine carbamoyltransferase
LGKEIAHQGVYKDRDPHSVIFDEAENRLNARKAIMRRVPGGLITR